MAITLLPTPPQRSDPANFSARADAFMVALPTFGTEANALAVDVNAKQVAAAVSATAAAGSVSAAAAQVTAAQAASAAADYSRIAAAASAAQAQETATGTILTGTSATSLLIATGDKTFTTQAGKQYANNIFITAISASDSTRFMSGTVSSYSGTTLVIAVTAVGGSGDTKADWNISVTGSPGASAIATLSGNATGAINWLKGTAPAASTTPDIWAAGGNRVPINSTTTITDFPTAPQAGAERTLVAMVGFSLTNGANLVIAGGSTTLNVGDEIDVIADTPTLFKAWVRRASSSSGVLTGDTLTTARTLPAPDWLLCDGSAYLQTSYPALYAVTGSPFALMDMPIPTTTQTTPTRVVLTPDATVMVVADGSVNVGVYLRTGDTFTQQTSLTLPGAADSVTFNADASMLAVSHANSPYMRVYSRSGSVFTQVTGLPTFPAGAQLATFSPDGTKIAMRQTVSPYIAVYSVSGTTFTKWADTATPPSVTNIRDFAFSPDGGCLALALISTPFTEMFSISGTVLTKLSPPAVLPTGGQGRSVAFDTSSSTLAVSHSAFPYVTIYSRASNVFTKLADPMPAPSTGGAGYCAKFDNSGKHLVLCGNLGSPVGMVFYKRSGDAFSAISQKITQVTANAQWLAFSGNAKYMAATSDSAPLIRVYSQTYDPSTQFAVPTISVGAFTYIKS